MGTLTFKYLLNILTFRQVDVVYLKYFKTIFVNATIFNLHLFTFRLQIIVCIDKLNIILCTRWNKVYVFKDTFIGVNEITQLSNS